MLPLTARPTAPRAGLALAALLLAAACRSTPATEETMPAADVAAVQATGIMGPTWTLVQLGGAAPPPGSGGRPATVVFDAANGGVRAGGHAGCNRWSSTAEFIPPDGVRFEAPVSTKMACVDGMELEQRFLTFVARVHSFRVSGNTLVLNAEGGQDARFERR